MSWEQGTFVVTMVIAALQAWNIYISASLKLWVTERFVAKADLQLYEVRSKSDAC